MKINNWKYIFFYYADKGLYKVKAVGKIINEIKASVIFKISEWNKGNYYM